jgi:hypothetical protein
MAALRRSVDISSPVGSVWDATRDFGQLYVPIAPVLVTDLGTDMLPDDAPTISTMMEIGLGAMKAHLESGG